MESVWPVVYEEAGRQRNATGAATSCGSPTLMPGELCTKGEWKRVCVCMRGRWGEREREREREKEKGKEEKKKRCWGC